jgi:hypothetical protein
MASKRRSNSNKPLRPTPKLAKEVDREDNLYRVVVPNSITGFALDLLTSEPVLDESNFAPFVGRAASCVSESICKEYNRTPQSVLAHILGTERQGIIKFAASAINSDMGKIKYIEFREQKPSLDCSDKDVWRYAHCAIYNSDSGLFDDEEGLDKIKIIDNINSAGWTLI